MSEYKILVRVTKVPEKFGDFENCGFETRTKSDFNAKKLCNDYIDMIIKKNKLKS